MALGIPAIADLNLILGSSAQVAYTSGDGVNVRDGIGYYTNVITTLPEGAAVTVLDGPVAADDGSYWYYVNADGVEGWVISDYLSLPSSATSSLGEIAFTGGDGVNVRAWYPDGGVITTLHEGAVVSLLAGPEWDASGSAWWLIGFEGVEGWVMDSYISSVGSGGSGSSSFQAVDAGWVSYVVGTDGAGLRLRDAASYDSTTLLVIPEGESVYVIASEVWGADGTEWWQVEYAGVVGYSVAYYLGGAESVSTPSTDDAAGTDTASSDSGSLWPGIYAQVVGTGGEGINLRYEMGYGSGIIGSLGEGAVVYVVDGPYWDGDSSPWYLVDADGVTGWAHGGYLAYIDYDPSGGGSTAVAEDPAPAYSSDPVGDAIVAEAMQYVGLPYVWGGTTPAGFDCSGFTHYVMSNIIGSFTRSLEVQAVSGSYVDPSNLVPGDLVFFQNTYTWGLSHTGIYIGGGQFVHAGSERTGVTVSDMWDSYWSPRYYTARRVRA